MATGFWHGWRDPASQAESTVQPSNQGWAFSLSSLVELGISISKELSRRLKSLNAPVVLKEKIRHKFVK